MSTKNQKKKKIIFKGKNIYYKNISELSKKIFGKKTYENATKEGKKDIKEKTKFLLNDLKEGGNSTRYLVNKDGEVITYDLKKKPPLLFEKFGIKKIRTSKFISKEDKIKDTSILSDIRDIDFKGTVSIDFKFTYDNKPPASRRIIIPLNNINEKYTDEELKDLIKNVPEWNFLNELEFQITEVTNIEYRTLLDQKFNF